ncbi:amino acid adenylation domain-containing protein [Saccharophagus sp. K07]|uniref:amino acid adenylation domain-containing protein n=1 Tax=Saccharophagus sp. K07 TaxID=2283636 RepID=UPI0016524B0C|nr:amino acid adenylation domain-containing protein [Saccharophagus sp. K07]MBC6906210.1 amino acid adenylation domain-containing protein [Saccharophagus sp. K07]
MSSYTWNLFAAERESCGFLAYVDHWVGQRAADPAVSFAHATLTYAELAVLTRRIAAGLQRCGVQPGSKVGVGVSRSEMLVPLLLAVWSLRAAYVPVDPSYPPNRQSYILENSQADILIVDKLRQDVIFPGSVVALDSLFATDDVVKPLANVGYQPDDIAYMIYTSGSTGNPKGVVITQANLINFLLGMAEQPGMHSRDRLLAVTTISFDIHILELFLPLLVGAHVIVASRQEATTPDLLQRLIDQWKINIVQATPATWRMLLSHNWQPRQKLKILVGGEALPVDLRPLMHAISTELWNMYGPTETTVWSTCHRIDESDSQIFIGKPIRRTSIYVVDEKSNPVADGMVGELLIGGAGVALGYYRNSALTDEKFIIQPQLENGRIYRTGDAVIQRGDGVLQYVGRIDNQIKIRGFRIEPGEIEHVLARHPKVKQAAVVATELTAGDTRMMAFYLGDLVESSELYDFCHSHLPRHMVPHHFIWLADFPMTANYKVDRKALVAIGHQRMSEGRKSSDARDDLDHSLLYVWEKALGINGISIDDDFFALGGHSLLALQVLTDMHKATGLSFSSSAFFKTPTIRALRDSLGDKAAHAASVVKLNSATGDNPIFCLCGVQIYRDLAQCFEDRRPVFGVFAKKEFTIIESSEDLHFSFDAFVQSYVDAIKRQGGYSSITLVGLSFGGLVALEVAKILLGQGVKISGVVLLDSYISSSGYRSIRKLMTDLRKRVQREGMAALRQIFERSLRKIAVNMGIEDNSVFDLSKEQKVRERAYDRAAILFERAPRHYDFDVLLIKATKTNFGFGLKAKRDYDLKSIVRGQLKIREVDADHANLMTGNAVMEVYESIRACEQKNG